VLLGDSYKAIFFVKSLFDDLDLKLKASFPELDFGYFVVSDSQSSESSDYALVPKVVAQNNYSFNASADS
jgi:hypothetical protein